MTEPEDNPKTSRVAVYHIIIEAHDVEDTEFQVGEVNELTKQLVHMLSFDAKVWLNDVEYEIWPVEET